MWETCRLAQAKGVAVHIVDRSAEALNTQNDPYYKTLMKEFGYKGIEYANHTALSVSKGGRVLTTKGVANKKDYMEIILVSMLIQ